MNLKGTQTEKNLLTAFAGESQARNRYDYFASAAKKEGYEQIAAIFAETALNEKEHAKRLFKFLQGGEVEITAAFPAGVIGQTTANLEGAAAGEKYEHEEMYPEFARIAKEEGFDDIAEKFLSIASVEKHHEERFRKLLANIENGTVFKKDGKVFWKCLNCGHIHEGEEAPEICPTCDHAQGYFQLLDDCF